jgi:hypothetical protein
VLPGGVARPRKGLAAILVDPDYGPGDLREGLSTLPIWIFFA